jgi:diguanylate cyclase (GGDEF)-like protein
MGTSDNREKRRMDLVVLTARASVSFIGSIVFAFTGPNWPAVSVLTLIFLLQAAALILSVGVPERLAFANAWLSYPETAGIIIVTAASPVAGAQLSYLVLCELFAVSFYGGFVHGVTISAMTVAGTLLTRSSAAYMLRSGGLFMLSFVPASLGISIGGSFLRRLMIELQSAEADHAISLRRLRALNEVEQRSLGKLNFDEVMAALARQTQDLFSCGSVAIVLKNDSGRFTIAYSLGAHFTGTAAENAAWLSDPLFEQGLNTGRTVALTCPPGGRYERALCAPMINEGSIRGFLAVINPDGESLFTAEEIDTLECLAASAAVAIANSELYEASLKRAGYLAMFNEIGRSFAATLDLDQLFEVIYSQVQRFMDTGAFFLALYDERREEVDVHYCYDRGKRVPPVTMPLNNGPTSQAITIARTVVFGQDDTNYTRLGDEGDEEVTKSGLIVPLVLRGRVIGALSAQSYTNDAYTKEHEGILEAIGAQAAIAVSNARLYNRTLTQALTDELTGLGNARQFHETLSQMVSRALVTDTQCALVMMDSDSLKQINDKYGHPAGNAHLVDLASVLKANVRSTDRAFRYAGDEFMVILPGASTEQAREVAERIQSSVSGHFLQLEDAQVRATVSMGVAVTPQDGSTVEELIKAADDALYRAKRNGKNQVILAS